jgi:hypothetical protein
MTTAEKLLKIYEAKIDILSAIRAKGVAVPSTLPFTQYGDKIRDIQIGAGGLTGEVIATPPSGVYNVFGFWVQFYANNIESPRFFSSDSYVGPYAEVILGQLMIDDSNTVYVFASDQTFSSFTSIQKFDWVIENQPGFTDSGSMATGLQLSNTSRDAVSITMGSNAE